MVIQYDTIVTSADTGIAPHLCLKLAIQFQRLDHDASVVLSTGNPFVYRGCHEYGIFRGCVFNHYLKVSKRKAVTADSVEAQVHGTQVAIQQLVETCGALQYTSAAFLGIAKRRLNLNEANAMAAAKSHCCSC